MELSVIYQTLFGGGIVIFLLAVFAVVRSLRKGSSVTAAVLLFAVALVFLAFPMVTKFKMMGIEAEIQSQWEVVKANPDNIDAREKLDSTIEEAKGLSGVVQTPEFARDITNIRQRLQDLAEKDVAKLPDTATKPLTPDQRRSLDVNARILERVAPTADKPSTLLQKAQRLKKM